MLTEGVSKYAESGIRGQCMDWWIRSEAKAPPIFKLQSELSNLNAKSSTTTIPRLTSPVFTTNMASQGEDDLQASTTEGFKVGEKKTVEEYAKLGQCMKLSFRTTDFIRSRIRTQHCSPTMPSLRRIKSVQDLYILLDNLIPLKRCQLCYYDVEDLFAASIWETSRRHTPPLFSCKRPSIFSHFHLNQSLEHLT